MSSTPVRDEIKDRIPEPRAIEEMIVLAGELEFVLRKIIEDLPRKKDWLDPSLERRAKYVLGLIK